MPRRVFLTALLLGTVLSAATNTELTEQVRQTETAFAKTMADRNLSAFTSFLSKEAVFLSPGKATRGRQQIAAEWKGYFDGPKAPFSWEPDQVEVLDSGTLAMTSGPVKNPQGKRIGTFHSVWRREARGLWKIVLDNGCPRCQGASVPVTCRGPASRRTMEG
jgi:ketosteroid isomerase-like protein